MLTMKMRSVVRVCIAPALALCLLTLQTPGMVAFDSASQVNSPADQTGSLDDWFYSYVTYGIGQWSYAVEMGDLNNDGLLDIVVANTGSSLPDSPQLSIFLQDDAGELVHPVTTYATVCGPTSLAIGDLNNDSLDDVVVGSRCSDDHRIGVLLQQLDGGMSDQVTYSTNGGRVAAMTAGDFNNDGRDDVAVALFGMSQIGVYLQDENGKLQDMVTYPALNSGDYALKVGDLNNDGLTDIVLMHGSYARPNISVYLQNAGGTLNSYISYDIGPDCTSPSECYTEGISVGDVTGDGLDDIVASYIYADRIAVFAQNADGTLEPGVFLYDAYAHPASVGIGDINMDGRNDVIVAHSHMQSLSLYLQHEIGLLSPYESYPIPYYSYSYGAPGMPVGDINGDERPDVSLIDGTNLVVLYHTMPDFAIGITPESTTIEPTGGSITYTANITGLYHFTDPVTLNVLGLPSGATSELPSGSLSVPDSIEFSVQVSPTTLTSFSSYSVTVVGASGTLTHTASAEIFVLYRVFLPLVHK